MDPKRRLLIEWEDPHALAAANRELSGLDALRSAIDGRGPKPPIAALMGFRLVEVEHGHAVFEGEPGEQHYNPIGVVHGGYAMTILDSAMGCAVHSTLAAGIGYTTLEVKVNMVRALTAATGSVRCEGRVIYAGRRQATAEGRITDTSGRLYAHGTTTCMIFPASPD